MSTSLQAGRCSPTARRRSARQAGLLRRRERQARELGHMIDVEVGREQLMVGSGSGTAYSPRPRSACWMRWKNSVHLVVRQGSVRTTLREDQAEGQAFLCFRAAPGRQHAGHLHALQGQWRRSRAARGRTSAACTVAAEVASVHDQREVALGGGKQAEIQRCRRRSVAAPTCSSRIEKVPAYTFPSMPSARTMARLRRPKRAAQPPLHPRRPRPTGPPAIRSRDFVHRRPSPGDRATTSRPPARLAFGP